MWCVGITSNARSTNSHCMCGALWIPSIKLFHIVFDSSVMRAREKKWGARLNTFRLMHNFVHASIFGASNRNGEHKNFHSTHFFPPSIRQHMEEHSYGWMWMCAKPPNGLAIYRLFVFSNSLIQYLSIVFIRYLTWAHCKHSTRLFAIRIHVVHFVYFYLETDRIIT